MPNDFPEIPGEWSSVESGLKVHSSLISMYMYLLLKLHIYTCMYIIALGLPLKEG